MSNFRRNSLVFSVFQIVFVSFDLCSCFDGIESAEKWISSNDAKEKLSEDCRKQFLIIFRHGESTFQSKLEIFLDLNSHLPLTNLSNLPSLGDYERCELRAQQFSMKYCSIHIYLHQIDEYLNKQTNGTSKVFKQLPITWTASAFITLCVPKECTATDVIILQDGFQLIQLNKPHFDYSVLDVNFDDFSTPKVTIVLWIFIYFTLLVLLINVLSRYTCVISMKSNILSCFNLRKHFFGLLARNTGCESTKMAILDGVRSLSILWVVYAVIFDTNLRFPNEDALGAFKWIESFSAGPILMSPMTLYQFQTINGFVLGYIQPSFGTSLKQRVFGIILPMYPLLLIFHTSLSHMGSGPLWFSTQKYLKSRCTNNVWRSYALIQNFYDPLDMCTIHTWYISVDFHLILLSPFLFFMMRRNFKMASYVILSVAFSICLYSAYIGYTMQLEPTLQSWVDDYLSNIYFPSHMRSPVWLCSLLAGYAYKEKKLNHIKMRLEKYYKHGCITSIAFISFTTLFTLYAPFWNLPLILKSLYIGFHNLFWSWMVLWIILVYMNSRTSHTGIIYNFLSAHIFSILVRLSYGLYLTAPLVDLINAGSRRTLFRYTAWSNTWDFLSELPYKLCLSVYWYLFIQAPILSLSTYFTEKPTKE